MLLYHDACFLEHDTGGHPDSAGRLRRVHRHLEQEGLVERCRARPVVSVPEASLHRLHQPQYVRQVRELADRQERGKRTYIEADTVVSRRSYEVARFASGCVCDAARQVVEGESRRALCLVRPPGHHALRASAMGFCLFNHVAVAARTAIAELGLDRVLIVDWDVHHGNGTQAAFWEDEQVAFLSIHRFPFYPGTGDDDETGAGKGLGTIRNLPVAFGTSRDEYHKRLARELEDFANRHRPQLVLVSAGFDAHRLDPIGSLGLEVEDFARLTRLVLDAARTHAEGRLVSLLEGGYHVDILPLAVAAHLETLLADAP